MRPDDFIAAAGKLAAIAQGNEALLRSAVSRAYYGVFHLTLELLGAASIDLPRNASAHVRCRRLLAACGQPLANDIAEVLADLHADRIRADYRLTDNRYRAFARVQSSIERANDAAGWIAECTQEPIRSEIASELKSCIERGM
jgi:uncharacterized protein (UPF0332 family)